MKSRSMTFLWQLTKDWKAEWGGAYYWNHAYYENAYQHASFNTLIMWSVTSQSVHAVTPVTRNAPKSAQRLTFGGWYSSQLDKDDNGNIYDIHNDKIEEWYSTYESRMKLTVDECKAIIAIDIDSDLYQDLPDERRMKIAQLQDDVLYDGFGPYEETHIYTLGTEEVGTVLVEEDGDDDGDDKQKKDFPLDKFDGREEDSEDEGGVFDDNDDDDVTPAPVCEDARSTEPLDTKMS